MSDMGSSSVQQAAAKMAPLIAMLGDQGQAAVANLQVPMSLDAAYAQPNSPSYFRSLEALLQPHLTQHSDAIVRSQTGSYSTPFGSTSRAPSKDGESSAKTDDLAKGLGLFSPKSYMKGSKDQGGGDGQGQQRGQGQAGEAVRQISMLAQILQSQQMMQAQQNPLQSLLAPLNKDALVLNGITPEEFANTFNELMVELGQKLAEMLNGLAENSGVDAQEAGQLESKVPNNESAKPADLQAVIHLLEDAMSLKLLQESTANPGSPDSESVMDAARLVLSALVNKLQAGEIEANPATMATIINALEGILQLNPQLTDSPIGKRIIAMKEMIAGIIESSGGQAELTQAATASAETPSAPEESSSSEFEQAGWSTAKSTGDSLAPQPLTNPFDYTAVASANVDPKGNLTGLGFNNAARQAFNYQLVPNKNGRVWVIGPKDKSKSPNAFVVSAKMEQDDEGHPVALTEGEFVWNGGNEAVRMDASGQSEVTNNGGNNWVTLPTAQESRYTSPDGRFKVTYDPTDRKVRMVVKDPSGKQVGSATMVANGDAVAFANIACEEPSMVG